MEPQAGQADDPLRIETLQFLEQWHHGRDCEADGQENDAEGKTLFSRKLREFREMWNGPYAGHPVHRCSGRHCKSKAECVARMAATFISLLLTALPAVPAPNKWCKIFPSSDFVGLGLLVNNVLPGIFNLAFQPMMFAADLNHEEADPRLVEGLYFHAVQGKRYLGSREFLTSPDSQLRCRIWLLVSEHLRRLVFFWLRILKVGKKVRARPAICELLDPRTSVAWAVLQNVARQLLDPHGRGRLVMIWRPAGFPTYGEWCAECTASVRELRRVLICLAGWVYRRHVVYWQELPWPLLQFVDREAEETTVQAAKNLWESSFTCCAAPGLARDLKRMGVSADELATNPKWTAVLAGYGALLEMTIADVECKHALSKHWADRPFPTITAKHINREAAVCVEEARLHADSLKTLAAGARAIAPTEGLEGRKQVSVQVKTPAPRAKSAYMFFRDDLLAAQQRVSSDVVNPCSREFWASLKEAWAALPEARKAYYEDLAQESIRSHAAKRLQSRQKKPRLGRPDDAVVPAAVKDADVQPDEAPSGAEMRPLSQYVPGSSLPAAASFYNPWVLASSLAGVADLPEMAREIGKYFTTEQDALADLADDCLRCSPVSEEQLQQSWKHNISQGRTWAVTLQQFNAETQRFAMPSNEDLFPERIIYQSSCGLLCRTKASPGDIRCFQSLLDAFDTVVCRCGDGSIASASKCDILLRCSITTADADHFAEFYSLLTSLSARSGPHASGQIFVSLDVVAGSVLAQCRAFRIGD